MDPDGLLIRRNLNRYCQRLDRLPFFELQGTSTTRCMQDRDAVLLHLDPVEKYTMHQIQLPIRRCRRRRDKLHMDPQPTPFALHTYPLQRRSALSWKPPIAIGVAGTVGFPLQRSHRLQSRYLLSDLFCTQRLRKTDQKELVFQEVNRHLGKVLGLSCNTLLVQIR